MGWHAMKDLRAALDQACEAADRIEEQTGNGTHDTAKDDQDHLAMLQAFADFYWRGEYEVCKPDVGDFGRFLTLHPQH